MGLFAQVRNQTRGALCVGNLGTRGSFDSAEDIAKECLRGGPPSSWRASDKDEIVQPTESFTIAQLLLNR